MNFKFNVLVYKYTTEVSNEKLHENIKITQKSIEPHHYSTNIIIQDEAKIFASINNLTSNKEHLYSNSTLYTKYILFEASQ